MPNAFSKPADVPSAQAWPHLPALPGSFAADAEDALAFAQLEQRRLLVTGTFSHAWGSRLRFYLRCLRLFLHLCAGVVLALVSGAAVNPYRAWQRPLIRWWHGRLCRILNIEIRVQGEWSRRPALWVSNHVSWLDIPVLGAMFPVHFLSKAEVARWPLVGWLARVAGTLFIQRGAGDAGRVGDALVAHLQAGRSVLFFPEGTTTDGQRLKRFFHKLFAVAVVADKPVQPVLLSYRDASDRLHPLVPFVGDDTFLAHASDILRSHHRIVVEVQILPVEAVRGRDARLLCRDIEAKMAEALAQLQEGLR